MQDLKIPDLKDSFEFVGYRPSKALARTMQKKIEKWVKIQKGLFLLQEDAPYNYHLKLELEGDPEMYSCEMHIEIDSLVWERRDYGKSPQEALLHCLKHLKVPSYDAKALERATA